MQEEIDNAVGRSSLVTLSDRSKLPYTDATLAEIWRLGPVGPIAATRVASKDTMLGGYFIEKGNLRFQDKVIEVER